MAKSIAIAGIGLTEMDFGQNGDMERRLIESTTLTRDALARLDALMSEQEGQIAKTVRTDVIVARTTVEIGDDLSLAGDIIFTGQDPDIRVPENVTLKFISPTIGASDPNPYEWYINNGSFLALAITGSGTVTDGSGNAVAFQGTSVSFINLTLTGGRITMTEQAEGASPAVGTHKFWFDSADSEPKVKNSAGTINFLDTSDAHYLALSTNSKLTDERVFNPDATLSVTDNGAGGNYDIGLDLSNSNTWVGEQVFTGGISLLDNDIATFGTGDDMSIYHDGTTNFIQSDIPDTDGAEAIRIVWDVDTDRTGLGGSDLDIKDGDAKLVATFGHTDSGGAYSQDWGMYPYARAFAINPAGPALIHYPWDGTNTSVAIGALESGGDFTGLHFAGTAGDHIINFIADSISSLTTNTRGIVIGSATGNAEIRSVSGKLIQLRPNSPPSDAARAWVMVETQSNQTGTSANDRAFLVNHRGPGQNIFSCWPGTTYTGGYMLGTEADIPFCFDASGSTRGTNLLTYVSASSELQASLGGNAFAIMNGKAIRFYDTGSSNYVGFVAPALTGDQVWTLPDADGQAGDVLTTDGAGALSWLSGASEKAWTFTSPAGSSGVFYYGGFYEFAASDNDFNPSINFGTANSSYAAHFFVVCAAGGSGGTDTVVRVTGTSINDSGTRTAADTEDLTLDDAGAAGAYYETAKKFIGQVTVALQSGPDLLCNYGWSKYWDANNSDFKVTGLECTWLAGANDSGINIRLLHHKTTGWTYNAGSTPTPPTPMATLQGDHVTEYEAVNNENGAWKRSNLAINVNGSASEGTIWEVTTTANKAFELGNILMRITTQ